jgi:hypothetical protein
LGGFLLQSWSLLATIETVLQITFLYSGSAQEKSVLRGWLFLLPFMSFLATINHAKRYAPPYNTGLHLLIQRATYAEGGFSVAMAVFYL